jgi:DNA polymerase V
VYKFVLQSTFQRCFMAFLQVLPSSVPETTALEVRIGGGENNFMHFALPEWKSVCDLTALTESDQDALIGGPDVGEVWGVGRRIGERLAGMGITTVRQLRNADPAHIRRAFSVVLERTVLELQGASCLALEEMAPATKQIMASRSFGQSVFELQDLENAVGNFIARAAEKLRSQESCAGAVMVFAHTSPFRDTPQYSRNITAPISNPTDDTLVLTNAAMAGLAAIYRPGFAYAKAGVMLSELIEREHVPKDRFNNVEQREKSFKLMAALDKVNARFGRGKLTTGAAATHGIWRMKQDRKSPSYATAWSDLIRLRS